MTGGTDFLKDDIQLREAMQKCVGDYLDRLSRGGAAKGYEVGPMREVYHGWRELYPKLGQRVLAWIGARVLRLRDGDRQRWFHTVLPYQVKYVPSFLSRALHRTDGGGWMVRMEFEVYADANEVVDVAYWARLRTPYTTTIMDISIQPLQPLRSITVDVVVTQGGNDPEPGSCPEPLF